MWQDASGSVLALSPVFFGVQVVIRKLLVVVTEAQWGHAGWEELLCPAYWSALQRERSLAVQEEREGIKWFLYQNLLQSTLFFSLLSLQFEKPVVWRGKGFGRQTLDVWGADVGMDAAS